MSECCSMRRKQISWLTQLFTKSLTGSVSLNNTRTIFFRVITLVIFWIKWRFSNKSSHSIKSFDCGSNAVVLGGEWSRNIMISWLQWKVWPLEHRIAKPPQEWLRHFMINRCGCGWINKEAKWEIFSCRSHIHLVPIM
jgi:hypothetical protein